MANKVPSSYVDIMLELDTLTKEYSALLTGANKAGINVLNYDDGRNKLTAMKEKLESLERPIRKIDDYFSRVEANDLMVSLLNAIKSSLRYPLLH